MPWQCFPPLSGLDRRIIVLVEVKRSAPVKIPARKASHKLMLCSSTLLGVLVMVVLCFFLMPALILATSARLPPS